MKTSDNNDTNYYYRELSKIITTGEYNPMIQVRDSEGNVTKWLSLNVECIDEVIYMLQLMRKNK